MKQTHWIAISILLLFLAGCAVNDALPVVPKPSGPLEETCSKLGIEGDCNRVVIFSQASHLDWDWQNWFPTMASGAEPVVAPGYFGCGIDCAAPSESCNAPKPTTCIFSAAETLLTASDRFRYSVCEMAFLRAFAESTPEAFARLKASPGLRIVGGGITSPDNLLPHGEAFLRNFLVGKTWMDRVGLDWTSQIWLPDDFGHDSQLPIALRAMGAEGVGFARVPGACDGFGQTADRKTSTATRLLGQISDDPGGVDFLWQANDGSEVLAHWMQAHYGQGNNVARGGTLYTNPVDQSICDNAKQVPAGNEQVAALIGNNGPVSPTPFIYVPVSGDFILPVGAQGQKPDLLEIVDTWNNDGHPPAGVAAMVGTFDDYVQLVRQSVQQPQDQPARDEQAASLEVRSFHSADRPFEPTPYWMGFYASRPALKGLHVQTTRNLLAAETFAALPHYISGATAHGLPALAPSLFEIWNDLAPSTHHDYITGTAIDVVYDDPSQDHKEQLALSKETQNQSEIALAQIITSISKQVPISEPSAIVFNALGLDRQGLVEVDDGQSGRLLCATVPSLGYQVQPLDHDSCPEIGTVDIQFIPNQSAPDSIIVGNRYLRATITKDSNWSVTSLVDRAEPNTEIFSGPANDLAFYSDGGDLYGFGYECDETFSLDESPQTPNPAIEVQQEDLRIQITTQVTFGTGSFTKQYTLLAGERMLRMTTTGAAPSNTTVTTRFPFAKKVDTMVHGTPYHWDYKPTKPYRNGGSGFNAIFQATHDFVLAQASDENLGAIYHGLTDATSDPITPGVPMAWAVEGDNLLGVVLRNTDGNCHAGAQGTDDGTHSVSYAFRLPGGLPLGSDAGASGQLLQEARRYNTPLRAIFIGTPQSGTYPTRFSLASINQPTAAMLTAAKIGTANADELILRIYQPTNEPKTVRLNLAPALETEAIRIVTAVETPIATDPATSAGTEAAEVPVPWAVTTLAIGGTSEQASVHRDDS